MKKLDYFEAIKESEKKLLKLERKQTKALLRDRMRFLRLLKSGQCVTQAQAAKIIGISLGGAEKLWRMYRINGLPALLDYPFKGKREKIDVYTKLMLLDELSKGKQLNTKQVAEYIKEMSGINYSKSGIHYLLKRLNMK
ncbi:MAG: winged helix-turn-helix domain-containing protein [Williamsia sp.]|nr:winged helix-turn-helix domain-containing protein [Williamsia sp.]